jgi:hypothetical protein
MIEKFPYFLICIPQRQFLFNVLEWRFQVSFKYKTEKIIFVIIFKNFHPFLIFIKRNIFFGGVVIPLIHTKKYTKNIKVYSVKLTSIALSLS